MKSKCEYNLSFITLKTNGNVDYIKRAHKCTKLAWLKVIFSPLCPAFNDIHHIFLRKLFILIT